MNSSVCLIRNISRNVGSKTMSKMATAQTGHCFGAPLWIVLLGRRKAGKSSTGNIILGRKEFKTRHKTTTSEKGFGSVYGQRVGVVDTPGWSLFGCANTDRVRQEILRSSSVTSYGSRVFLLVIPADLFTENDRRAVEEHVELLGDRVWHDTIVLFTWGDLLRGKSIEKHIEKVGEPLQWVLQKCANRYFVISNKTGCSDTQIVELLQYIRTHMAPTFPNWHALPTHHIYDSNFSNGAPYHWRGHVSTHLADSIEMTNAGRWRHLDVPDTNLYPHTEMWWQQNRISNKVWPAPEFHSAAIVRIPRPELRANFNY